MSEQRLSSIQFSSKRGNHWSVDLNTSSVYRSSGDRLLDQSAFHTSRQADTLLISGQSINLGGNLSLGRGKDTLILQLSQISGENAWTINTGENHDRLELHQPPGSPSGTMEAFNIQMDSGDDYLIGGSGYTLEGSNDRYGLITTGLGRDTVELGQATLSYVNLDTGLGNDNIQLLNVEACNLSTGDDSDVIRALANGIITESFLAFGAGDDILDLRGSLVQSSIDMGSGDDRIEARESESLTRVAINTGEGDDALIADTLSDCSLQSGDGNDEITGHLFGVNDIALNDGDDVFRLTSFTNGGSTINGGTGDDLLRSDLELIITSSNEKGLPSYTKTINDTGTLIFTYYGNSETPLLTLIGFEQLSFANASFDTTL